MKDTQRLKTEINLKQARIEKQQHELTELQKSLVEAVRDNARQAAEKINAKNEEPSAARQYAKECADSIPGTKSNIHTSVRKLAHEAGQKHGASVERERCQKIMRDYFAEENSCGCDAVLRALKNIESDTEPHRHEELMDVLSNGRWHKKTDMTIEFDSNQFNVPAGRYKLTPIKD